MDQKVVEIFSSDDELEISRASDYLEQNGIKVLVRNKGTQDLIGLGRIGTSINPLVGEYELCVLEKDKGAGNSLLGDIFPELIQDTEQGRPEEKEILGDQADVKPVSDHNSGSSRNLNARIGQCIVLNVLWLWGIGSLISFVRSFYFMKKRKVFFIVNTFFSIIGLTGAFIYLIYSRFWPF